MFVKPSRQFIVAFAFALQISALTLGCDSSSHPTTKDAGLDTVSSSSDTHPSDTVNIPTDTSVSSAGGFTGTGGMGHGGTAGTVADAGAGGAAGSGGLNDAGADVFGEYISTVNPGDLGISPCPPDGHQFCYRDTGRGTADLQGTCVGLLCCYGCIKNGVCYRGNLQTSCGTKGYPCAECGVTPGSEKLPTCAPTNFPHESQWTCQ